MDSGFCEVPLLPMVIKEQQIICGFCKYSSQAQGPFGVIMYDIVRSNTAVCRLAIMFSVPFDRNLYKNYIGLGIFEQSQPCNADLLQKMYYNTENDFKTAAATGGGISFESKGYTIKGTMSQGLGAYMWITVLNSSVRVKGTMSCDRLFHCFTIKKNKKKKQVSQ